MKKVNPIVNRLVNEAHDESLPVIDRLVALYVIGTFAQEGQVFVDEPKKPKYVWRNGARVKVPE